MSSCPDCGAIERPWARGHRRDCPHYRPAKSARTCPGCARPMAVASVRVAAPVKVTFTCRHGCDVSWVESTTRDQPDLDKSEDHEPTHEGETA